MISPWSAPAWMKNTKDLMGQNAQGQPGHLLEDEYTTYANYFIKVLQGYK